MHLMGVHLMGVHLMGVHLIGVHLVGVHLMGVHLIGVHVTGVHLVARSRQGCICIGCRSNCLHSVVPRCNGRLQVHDAYPDSSRQITR
jgi:hypothetical protein